MLLERDQNILQKALQEIELLEQMVQGIDVETYLANEEKMRATAMTLINIWELVKHLSSDFKQSAKDFPFDEIRAMRHIAAHEYQTLKFENVWDTIKEDIPTIKEQIEESL